MAVRLGLVLSALVVVLGIPYAIWARSQTPRDLDWLGPWIAVWNGAIALAVIWLGVLVALVVKKAVRVIGDARPDVSRGGETKTLGGSNRPTRT